MHLKIIACEVLYREISLSTALSPHTCHVEYTTKNAHVHGDVLRSEIQSRIDATPKGLYDAILLGYGLCGGGTVGLIAEDVSLVLPRAHDCCTLFLGSRQAFKEHFSDNPSRPYSSLGYMERGGGYLHCSDFRKKFGLQERFADYVALYGKDNACYIWDTLHPKLELTHHQDKVIFIEMPETAHLGWATRFQEKAAADGKEFKLLMGQDRLLQTLVNGPWNADEFLVVEPGKTIVGVYDWDEICRAVKVEETEKNG